jgi:uncharacterized delta-60 repeat protein
MALSSRIAALALPVLLLGLIMLPSAALGAGALDSSFDGDGKVLTDFGGNDPGNDLAIQADGKIVAAGASDGDFALARYNADGSLDTSFDGDGKVVTDIGGSDGAAAVAIQGDGKLVVAGNSGGDIALASNNADGSLDTSFDGVGTVVTDFGTADDFAYGVAIQADGKIVAVGSTGTMNFLPRDFALARYNADGSLDLTFGVGGKVDTDFGALEGAVDIAIQADGKLVVVGTGTSSSTSQYFELARYNANGVLDSSFGGGDGVVATGFSNLVDYASGVAIQADGKIVASGSACQCGNEIIYNFALARYNTDGSLDTSFDGDGKVVTDFGLDENAPDVAIQEDGKIIAAGTFCCHSGDSEFALARYNADGSLDPNFDFDGRVLSDFGGRAEAHAVAIDTSGKIVAAGSNGSSSSGPFDFALARYTSTGTTLPTISINDVRAFEGNAGRTVFTFTVSLSTASSQTITVSRETADGTATAPGDYAALAPATLTFSPGQTTKSVWVRVKGALAVEPNETFFVNLSSPTGATIADGSGKGTILNDDISGSAPCTITGTNANDVLNGTAGNDVICGGGGDDKIYGLDGADVLKGGVGDDLLVGGNGYDLLVGGPGIDDLRGANGNDTLRGGDQNDTLNGGANSDALFGDVGADSLNTQDGVSANDSADGGADSDSCVFDSGDFVTSCP